MCRYFCFLLILTFLFVNLSHLQGADEISTPFVGVTHIHRTRTEPRLLDINILIIDLSAQGLSFRVTPSNGTAPGETDMQTVRNFLIEHNAQIAINAGFFYWNGTEYDVMGFAASDGDNYSPFVTWYGFPEPFVSLNISQDNTATVINYDAWQPNRYWPPATAIYNAFPGSERIVHLGVNVTSGDYHLNLAKHPRTAAGVTEDNKLVLFTVDGRNPGHSEGMYTSEVADMLIEFGVYNGINLDGGGSTTMVFADPYPRLVNVPVGVGSEPGTERETANNLAVFATWIPCTFIFNDFEGADEGTFSYRPGYSGSTDGIIDAESTADPVDTEAKNGQWSWKIFIKDDPSVETVPGNPDGGWFVRMVSGSLASPSQNVLRPVSGYAGFWVKTSDSGLKISLAIDNESTMERGIPIDLVADGQWHLCQWNLEDSNEWEGWINGDGVVEQTEFTLDSIQIFGPNADTTLYIDDITHNPVGEVGEPANCQEVWNFGFGMRADMDKNCKVDTLDLDRLAEFWLGDESLADIAPIEGDGIVNLLDLTTLANDWLRCNDPQQ